LAKGQLGQNLAKKRKKKISQESEELEATVGQERKKKSTETRDMEKHKGITAVVGIKQKKRGNYYGTEGKGKEGLEKS